jgi:hypothetical protein
MYSGFRNDSTSSLAFVSTSYFTSSGTLRFGAFCGQKVQTFSFLFMVLCIFVLRPKTSFHTKNFQIYLEDNRMMKFLEEFQSISAWMGRE